MKDADAYTIQHQRIASIDLMEQAALAFVKLFTAAFPDLEKRVLVVCGQGNNGGDGLAIARLLKDRGYLNIHIFLAQFSAKSSPDYLQNLQRLASGSYHIPLGNNIDELNIPENSIVIDALLGSGLNKPLTGKYETLVNTINLAKVHVVSVDVPTGFKSEGEFESYNGIRADLAISFQRPKINFFFPESLQALANFKVVSIGLNEDFIQSLPSHWKLIDEVFINSVLNPRQRFSHKGTYGHALLVAGNTNTMGAALLSTSACLHTGVGLVTASIPQSGLTALNVSFPEAMFVTREQLPADGVQKYQAIGVGPGLGTQQMQKDLIGYLFLQGVPLVLDADALNMLSSDRELLDLIPAESIITPHMKEFDRLFGAHKNWWTRVETARTKARQLNIIIVLKNQYTFVCLPNGEVCINPTGNAAMAQGGMGDVLTGAITGLRAQGYTAIEAALIGVYLHGKAGDVLAKDSVVVTASNLAKQLAKVLKTV
jgi:NAD(P)H-hydrate epimerase